MSDLIAKLKLGRNALKLVSLNGVTLGLRLLTEQDYLEADIATQQAMKLVDLTLDVGTAEAFEMEKASQLLLRSLVDPETKQPLFVSAKVMREAFCRNDKLFLIEAYLAHEREFSPSEANLSPEAFDALLANLKKNPEMTALNDLSLDTLKKLLLCSVARPAN